MIVTQWFNQRIFFIFITLIFAISGCAKQTTVVLLPDPDGKLGEVTVTSDGGSIAICHALEATTVKGRQGTPTIPKIISAAAIQKDFAEALAILPEQPVHFILYFQRDSNKLTPASKTRILDVLATAEKRNSKDIIVIGHTDTAGNPRYNLRLSQNRAKAIAKILVSKGVERQHIQTTSHGEMNPLIPTKDNVHEPKNRRVEVVVR